MRVGNDVGNIVAEVPCPECGVTGKLKVEIRDRFTARPIGTFSLAGSQLKVSAEKVPWPFLVCEGCGFEEAGKPDE